MKMKKVLVSAAALTGSIAGATVVANADSITVQAGDTVSELAEKYNTTVNKIQEMNNLDNPDLIFVGEKLEVSAENTAQASTTNVAQQQSTTNNSQMQAATQTATSTQSTQQNTQQTSTQSYTSNVSGDEASARAWIIQHESGGNYEARNGRYYGAYQLDINYLNGDLSKANQDRTADSYVKGRYGSWVNAKNFWLSHNWY
ncbi:LysM peptidoglycan-binding domain-containing protein [Ligilactobacillus cholophilus]|uniref:aggregation-promoting factor n=1 Tax=Ligilactobacillus cholophilus TaxID=3050131 RepID=UPI0025B093DC|nr:LysM peptidoglycan-binding domain-containing protein [Ligilactobacillus cholophilus]